MRCRADKPLIHGLPVGLLLWGWVAFAPPWARADFMHLDPRQVLSAAGPSPKGDREAEAPLNEAAQELIQRRHGAAVTRLERLARRSPGDLRVWLLLSVAYLGHNQLPEGLAAAQRCVELNPKVAMGHWLRGMILTAQAKLDEAFLAYDKAVQEAPAEADGYLQRGRFRVLYQFENREHLRAAVHDLNKALDLGAPADAAHGFLGLAYRNLRDRDRAEAHFRKVLDLKPNHPDAVREFTSLYLDQGELSRAEQLLTGARKGVATLDPEGRGTLAYAEALYALAAKKPPADIDKHFRAALEGRSQDARVRRRYASWLDAAGRGAEMMALLREGLREAPFDPDLAAHLAWALADRGQNLDEARRWFDVARRRYPADPYLADTGAWIEFRAGNFPAAWTALGPSLALAEKVPEVAYHAGAIQAKLGNRSQAVHFLTLALRSGQPFGGSQEAKKLLETLQAKTP